MSLRTTALVAGVIGVLLLATGLLADARRPPRDVTPSAALDTAIVVYEPEMVAFAQENRIGVSGSGDIVAVTARPADAHAWLDGKEATVVTGLPDWETLTTTAFVSPAPTASPSPSPSGSPSPSPSPSEAEPSATPSPSPSASAGEGEEAAETVSVLEMSSQDHWREERAGEGRLSLAAATLPAGETVVIVSVDGSPLTSTDLSLTRDVQDGWITPLIWWGAILTAVGLIALILRFVDLRPAQAKGEEWIAKRQRIGDGEGPDPESRRARRESGNLLPETSLDEADVTTGSLPLLPAPEPRDDRDDRDEQDRS